MSDTTYTIQGSTLTGLGDAVRNVWSTDETFTPTQMISAINEAGPGIDVKIKMTPNPHVNPLTNEWQRPNNYPDLNALRDEIDGDQDCVYFTYDLSLHEDFYWLGLYIDMSSGNKWYLDRYDAGDFVHSHFELDKNTYFKYDLTEEPDNSDIQVWRLTSNGHISSFGFIPNDSLTFNNTFQPCVDRAGTLPWAIPAGLVNGLSTNKHYITQWLEHDGLIIGKNITVTSLASWWNGAYQLVSIDTDKWNVSNWAVTSLNQTWVNCGSLKKLDLSSWDTSNWAITTLYNAWNSCYSLEKLNLNNWDTSDWIVEQFTSVWSNCYSLQQLNINNWDTKKWTVQSFNGAWNNCYSLKKLDLSTWDTSNWAVTSLNTAWNNCYSLKKLDLSTWDTESWAVTNLTYAWNNCHALQYLNINNWDTSNWEVQQLSYVFAYCYSLRELKLNNWDTSNWQVTTLEGLCYQCKSLKILEIDKWDTSNWVVTTLYSMCNGCSCLLELNLNKWDTSKWAVTNIGFIFSQCSTLKYLNINTWDTSNWPLTNITSLLYNSYSLLEFDISNWDTTKWNLTSTSSAFLGVISAKTIKLPISMLPNASKQPISVSSVFIQNFTGTNVASNHSYGDAKGLTSTSLKSILNRLQTVSSTKTITLGALNRAKLTAEDIAVATNKGWTVA